MTSVTQNLQEQDDILGLIPSNSLWKEVLDGLLGGSEKVKSPFFIQKCAEEFEVITKEQSSVTLMSSAGQTSISTQYFEIMVP